MTVRPKLVFGNGIKASRAEKEELLAVAKVAAQLATGHWPLATKPIEFTILFCDDDKIKELNYDFRGKGYPTNVLSFPSFEPEGLSGVLESMSEGACYIGDIAISLPVVAREAREQHKNANHHLLHLVAHGVLHLFGFDHMNKRDAEKMEGLEIAILKKFKIPNPYI